MSTRIEIDLPDFDGVNRCERCHHPLGDLRPFVATFDGPGGIISIGLCSRCVVELMDVGRKEQRAPSGIHDMRVVVGLIPT